jgi:hypothetical protein
VIAPNLPKSPADFQIETAMHLPTPPTEAASITVEPGGLAGLENLKTSWDELRDDEEQMHICKSQLMVLAAMSGAKLLVMKKSLGYDQRGGDRRSNPTGSGLIATWDDVCRAELNITDDTANKRINIFLTAVERAKALEGGEHSPEFRVLTTPPALLNSADLEIMADALEKLLPEKNQNQLLRKIRPANAPKPPHTLTAADRKKAAAATADAKKARKNGKVDPELVRIFMDNFFKSIADTNEELQRMLANKKNLLVLPVRDPSEPAPGGTDSKPVRYLDDYAEDFRALKKVVEAGMGEVLDMFEAFLVAADKKRKADQKKNQKYSSKSKTTRALK